MRSFSLKTATASSATAELDVLRHHVIMSIRMDDFHRARHRVLAELRLYTCDMHVQPLQRA
jgi:hypothetical protein